MLEWKNLSYNIQDKKAKGGQKRILQGLAGSAVPGDLIALMGPSGSGKTSLLNALADRLPITKGANFQGEVMVNGIQRQQLPCPFADLSAYVEQDDALFALSTVQETLDFSAKLRLPSSTPASERDARIDDVLRQLGLFSVRHTNVGGNSFNGALRGISGGERKRLSIAIELLHRPKCIFLDEPTTGLDSYQALNVMENMSSLAKAGHTVLVSIHQPRSSIFAMMTSVFLLSRGQAVYVGPTDGAVDYLGSLGYMLPPKFNPADFLVDIVSIDQRDDTELQKTEARLTSLIEKWAARTAVDGKQAIAMDSEAQKMGVLNARAERPAGQHALVVPFLLLIQRGWREQMRDIFAIIFKVFFSAFFAVIFGLVYFQLAADQNSIQDRTGILFFLTMNQAFGAVISTSQVIPRQLCVVQRERASRLYAIFPFYISNLIVTLPIEAIPQIANNVLVYYMAGLEGSFFVFFAVLLMENIVGISIGLALSASFKNVTMAPQVAPAVVILFLLFNGFMINEESVPAYFIWLKEVSFIRYAFKAVMVNEFDGSSFTCSAADESCVRSGDQVLSRLKFDGDSVSTCLLILGGMAAFFNVLAYFILVWRRPCFQPLEAPAKDTLAKDQLSEPLAIKAEQEQPKDAVVAIEEPKEEVAM